MQVAGDGSHVVLVQLANGSTETRVEDGIVCSGVRVVECELDVVSGVTSDGQSWEGLDWEGGVGVWAASDEGRGDGVDHVETERGVVWARPGGARLDGRVLPSLVSSLDREDRSSDGEVGLVLNVLGRTGVSGHTDVFDDRGEADERGDIGVRAESELASPRDGGEGGVYLQLVGTSLNGVTSQSPRQKRDVVGFMAGDLAQSTSDPGWASGIGKVVL